MLARTCEHKASGYRYVTNLLPDYVQDICIRNKKLNEPALRSRVSLTQNNFESKLINEASAE